MPFEESEEREAGTVLPAADDLPSGQPYVEQADNDNELPVGAPVSDPLSRRRALLIGALVVGLVLCAAGVGGLLWPEKKVPPPTVAERPEEESAAGETAATPETRPSNVDPATNTEVIEASQADPPAASEKNPPVSRPSTTPLEPVNNVSNDFDPTSWFRSVGGRRVRADQLVMLDGFEMFTSKLMRDQAWTFVHPDGSHATSLSPQLVSAGQPFMDYYADRVSGLRDGGNWNFGLLLNACRSHGGVFLDPLLPHCWGNYYWQAGDADAALRHWNWAIRIEPTFAPSHLNRAFAFHFQQQPQKAREALALAYVFNIQDCYGIRDHVLSLQRKLILSACLNTRPQFDPDDFAAPVEQLTVEDQQVVGILETISDYAGRPQAKAKAMNNAGVYLLRTASKPRLALEYLRQAQGFLARANVVAAEDKLAAVILDNMEQAATLADYPERSLYAQLQEFYGS